jgi:glucose-6-phosphate dehydrogenase assembly protein OpcA
MLYAEKYIIFVFTIIGSVFEEQSSVVVTAHCYIPDVSWIVWWAAYRPRNGAKDNYSI